MAEITISLNQEIDSDVMESSLKILGRDFLDSFKHSTRVILKSTNYQEIRKEETINSPELSLRIDTGSMQLNHRYVPHMSLEVYAVKTETDPTKYNGVIIKGFNINSASSTARDAVDYLEKRIREWIK